MYFSQRDKKWATKKLGFGTTTFYGYGCAITSITNLHKFFTDSNLTPLEINEIAKNCGAFTGDMLNFGILANKLGYKYEKLSKKPKIRCIIETNFYKKVGVQQHFVFFNPENGKRIDSLDEVPSWEENNYPIVSYRVFTKIEEKPKKEVSKEVKVESNIQTPPKQETPIVTPTVSLQSESKTIKLSELPKIEEAKEYTCLDELKELILDLINLITKKK
jgi:hypothetical protein